MNMDLMENIKQVGDQQKMLQNQKNKSLIYVQVK